MQTRSIVQCAILVNITIFGTIAKEEILYCFRSRYDAFSRALKPYSRYETSLGKMICLPLVLITVIKTCLDVLY